MGHVKSNFVFKKFVIILVVFGVDLRVRGAMVVYIIRVHRLMILFAILKVSVFAGRSADSGARDPKK